MTDKSVSFSGRLASVGFGCREPCCLWVSVSSQTLCSSQGRFCVWQQYHGTQKAYFPLLVSQVQGAVYLSNQIIQVIFL